VSGATLLLIAHWVIIAAVTARVVTRRPPQAVPVAVAWLALVFSLPILGAMLYLALGEKRLGGLRSSQRLHDHATMRAWLAREVKGVPLDPERAPACASLALRLLGQPMTTGNQAHLLSSARDFFDELVGALDAAERTCELTFYIWESGGRVDDVADALARAAARGVRCRLLLDAIGSKSFLASAEAARLARAGVAIRSALTTGPLRSLELRLDLRNHRKLVVVDDRVAYIGSQNLADPRSFKQDAGVGQWVDAMARLAGPVVAPLLAVFELDWAAEGGEPFTAPVPSGESPGHVRMQVVPSGPAVAPEAIHQLLLTALYAARRSVVLTTPYFVPSDALFTALLSAATRGVAVRLVVPARNDSLLAEFAGSALYEALLSAGVRIHLYEGGLLHCKSLVIDDHLSVFGSVNLDMRSLWLDFELSVFVYDDAFAADLGALQARYIDEAVDLTPSGWAARPRWRRAVEGGLRLFGPLL
jgi:cardiolipin synthase